MLGVLGVVFVIGLVLASVIAAMRDGGTCPFRAVFALWRASSPSRRVVFVAALAVLVHFAGAKHGDGGGDDGGGASTNEPPTQLVGAVRPPVVSSPAPSIVPTSISEAAFDLGLIPVRVGQGETHDFAPSATASVVAEWLDHGAATDHLVVPLGESGFPWGTNVVRRLTVCAEGVVFPAPGDMATFLAPLRGKMGIVPAANWTQLAETNRPCRVWFDRRADGSFVLTWQNALLDRDAAKPVSFQLRLDPDGTVTFRYDLSRLADEDALTNAVAAVAANGRRFDIPLDRRLSSVTFARLEEGDRTNPDRDGDGVSTTDELLVYGTDPSCRDTDRDGLSDYEEIFVWHTDPLDANSRRTDLPDGMAVVLGDLDPFDIPPGSTNTVLEHAFYTGSTNAPFAYPEATDASAVLRVSAQGTGTGRVVVGDAVVPLVGGQSGGGPGLLMAGPGTPPQGTSFLVQVAKGADVQMCLYGGGSLSATYDSDEFAFGELPYSGVGGAIGFIDFPNTAADIPCIHDLNARRKVVTLPVGADAFALTCTWQGGSSVEVENRPPRSAEITGNFPMRETRAITYTLSHPNYLFGRTTYEQAVRFCPRPHSVADGDAEDDPSWLESGDGAPSDGSAFEPESEWWCCFWGRCDGECGCQGRCGCGCNCADAGGDSDGEVSAEVCAVHNVPYEQCAPQHWTDYTNAFESVEHLGNVLYIRDPLEYDREYLYCPYEHRHCCPCPDHCTNYVGIAYKSCRLKVVDAAGQDFKRSSTSCDVWIAGRHPSAAIGDAHLAFAANGEVSRSFEYTVLGVGISAAPYATPLSVYNELGRTLGVPMTVTTNLNHSLQLTLETNVRLPGGNIRLELADAEGQFTIWIFDYSQGKYEKLLDTEGRHVIDLSLARWRKLVGCASDWDSPETPIYVTSSRRGSVTLRFLYWGVVDGFFVRDQVDQLITSVNPPLLPDIGNDGRIDDADVAAYLDGKKFRFWCNGETVKGNYAKENPDVGENAFNQTVDGAYDLVNFFPLAVDMESFIESWGNFVTYRLVRAETWEYSFNYCFADMPWNDIRSMQTSTVHTVEGPLLRETLLWTIPREGIRLPLVDFQASAPSNRVMVAEAQDADCGMRLEIERDGKVLYAFDVPLDIRYVKELYSWINMRQTSDEWERRPTDIRHDAGREGRKQFIFLHGANVAEADAEIWGDQIYKRLWHSGADVDFYNVDWRSNIGLTGANYQENASNAFVVASNLAPILAAIPGEKVVMAHSLGNMVVSSMIQDHGLQVSKYLMCNSAVPAEAYDPSPALRVPQLVHPYWEDYPTNTWASCWHELFNAFPNDDRRLLGWPGRFADVAQYAVNFYSTGDEVLELFESNALFVDTGMQEEGVPGLDFGHLSWHKQELFKGRSRVTTGLGGTSWAGWGFNTVPYRLFDPPQTLLLPKYSASEAAALSPEQLRNESVFNPSPSSMTNSVIPLLVRGAILAQGIPALAPPTGGIVLPQWDAETSFNLNSEENNGGVLKPNGWPSRNRYSGRWLHSDMKDVAFYFTYKFYEKVIEKGALR